MIRLIHWGDGTVRLFVFGKLIFGWNPRRNRQKREQNRQMRRFKRGIW